MPKNSEPIFELLLKNGHVIDPANNKDEILDVAISGSVIAAVGKNIPITKALRIVDAKKLIITPGLIDLHAHFWGSVSYTHLRAHET